ncbi:hypothetical protein [Vibrio barjaei]|uniref:hypothetical protein n=1 Tax=Vibrio barjaei TaxID=1676683 RepID=UPI00228420CF|nr:hypothetical protein [Vibrio barjaei]MCY9873972.1 hypothetical protein [Vibrio barjaei]
MNKLALVVSIALASGTVVAEDVNFSNYSDKLGSKLSADNQSVILQSNNTTSSVVIEQGKLGSYDMNISVVDMRLQDWGRLNKVHVKQDGGFASAHDSLVKIGGTSGGADIAVDQRGYYNDSEIKLSVDADNNLVDVKQDNSDRAKGNWSDVAISGASDFNKVDIDQVGSGNFSEVVISGGSSGSSANKQLVKVDQNGDNNESFVKLYDNSIDNNVNIDQDDDGHYSYVGVNGNLNDIDVKQSGKASHSDINLYGESDSNIINVTQAGSYLGNKSEITLYASSGNNLGNHINSGIKGIRVNQTGGDVSTIVMNNSTNSAIYVNQQ